MIFDKVLSRTKSSGLATFVTFVVSAFWHGIYLTYYIGTFIITQALFNGELLLQSANGLIKWE